MQIRSETFLVWLDVFCRTDSSAELEVVKEAALAAGADDAVVCSHWRQGGQGAAALAEAVIKACQEPHSFQ